MSAATQRTARDLSRCAIAALALRASEAQARSCIVIGARAFDSIQEALDEAAPGDTVVVDGSCPPFHERVAFRIPGGRGPSEIIALEARPGGPRPILDGGGIVGDQNAIVSIENCSYVRLRGLEIRNATGTVADDASGVLVSGSGCGVEIIDNDIHDIRGTNGMGITVHGTDRTTPIADLLIARNVIHDCEPAQSEALTLNGNVERFEVVGNVVRDVNSIGIDFVGGEPDINPDVTKVARNGACRGNVVMRARSAYGGGYGAGIYVDGGRDIIIERNLVTECDLGIEIGAEHEGTDATGIRVRDNIIWRNDKAGLVFGGYDLRVGRVRACTFTHNTLVGNDALGTGHGELWMQLASGNVVRNNMVVATERGILLTSAEDVGSNELDYNLWMVPDGAEAHWLWLGRQCTGFAEYQRTSGQDLGGLFADPQIESIEAGDFSLQDGSPAIDRGDPAFRPGFGETDFAGRARVAAGRVDIGAHEAGAARCARGDVTHDAAYSVADAVVLVGRLLRPSSLGDDELPCSDPHPYRVTCAADGRGPDVVCLEGDGLVGSADRDALLGVILERLDPGCVPCGG